MTRAAGSAADYRGRVYQALTQGGDIDELIVDGEALLRRVEAATTPGVSLDVALALAHRYERSDSPTDLQQAITILRDAVTTSPAGSRSSVPLLANLGSLLLRSFERYARMPDLDEAIDRLTTARRIEGDFSSSSPVIHNSLGSALFRQAAATGSTESREASISLLERAVEAASPGSPEWVRRRLNLCNPLFLRVERGDQAAVDRIKRTVDDLLFRTEPASPLNWEILLVSSRAYRLAFEWSRDVQDLDRALADYRRLLSRHDLTVPDTALARSNFGNALRTEYEETGRADSLDESIQQFTAALELLADRPAESAKQRANLAKSLTRRYETNGDVTDLRTAIRLYRGVIAAGLLAEDNLRAESTFNLGGALLRLGQDLRDARAVNEGLSLLWETLSGLDPTENPGLVLEASRGIGQECLATGRSDLAADALQRGLLALEEADRLSTGSPSRHRLLRRGAEVVQLAALALVQAGRSEEAVLALERGRARAVADALKLDIAALDDLAAAGRADLADGYSSTVRELWAWESRIAGDMPDAAITQVRALHERLDALTREVRALPGFEKFARPVDLGTVRRAASAAALVYGCVTDFGAALLIVPGSGPVEAIDLPDLESPTVERRASVYLTALDRLRADLDSPSAEAGWVDALDELTGWLGNAFMTPLCTRLSERGVTRAALLLPGWLNLLPVTAARLSSGAMTPTDVLAWCHGPSAAALATASAVAATSTSRSAVLVGDPEPTEEEPLAGATAEVDGATPAFTRTTILMGSRATRDSVLRALPNHDVAHFACHGLGDPAEPLQSFLLLANDDQLTLRDILRLRVWRMRLCVLSACDTATVGGQAPDEYVSLPTGLVQAGAAAVIATQWPVWDVAAAVLSIRFYALWPERDADPGSAFRQAQLWLRDATQRDVQQFVQQRVPEGSRRALLDGLSGVPPEARPFHAAQDWAAFTYVGC